MAEHGILFQDEMVRALLRPVGDPLRKTVTRRTSDRWAKVKPGDLLWVREYWAGDAHWYAHRADLPPGAPPPLSPKTGEPMRGWRPSIHMPRWASRLTLRVVDVRREHCAASAVTHRWALECDPRRSVWLYGCSTAQNGYERAPCPYRPLPWVDDAEARREGVADRAEYLALWESINGPEYPEWVWRIEFEEVSRG